jgi:hypothetical protein
MSTFNARLGMWAALMADIAWLVITACFIAIPLLYPLFSWTNLAGYLAYAGAHDRTLVYVAQACMLLLGPLYVVMLSSLQEYAAPGRKGVERAALVLGIGFAILTGVNYFTQITAVRFNIARGTTTGLEQFLQQKPDSIMAAINMLGWTLYFGLSTLLASTVFTCGKLERAIRIALLANGGCCLLAGLGFLIDNTILVFLTINLGMGGAFLAATCLLCAFFWRGMRNLAPNT